MKRPSQQLVKTSNK